jgi:thioredoxin 1
MMVPIVTSFTVSSEARKRSHKILQNSQTFLHNILTVLLFSMSLCCIGGVCIPYTVIWPFILLILKQLWSYFYPTVDDKKKTDGLTSDTKESKACCKHSDTGSDIIIDTFSETSEALYLTDDMNWERIISQEKKTIVRFTAKWCKPCKAIEPYFQELAVSNRPHANFLSIDVDDFGDLAALHGAVSIPLFVCFQQGKAIGQLGGKDKEKLRIFVESLVDVINE